jgi:hypothetical protein
MLYHRQKKMEKKLDGRGVGWLCVGEDAPFYFGQKWGRAAIYRDLIQAYLCRLFRLFFSHFFFGVAIYRDLIQGYVSGVFGIFRV